MKTIKFNITRLSLLGIVCLALISPDSTSAGAKRDEFGAVVQAIEQYYHVKHQSIPFLARAGMKTTTTAMRIRGGQYKRLAEAGSIRIAFFEDQDFDSRGGLITFKTSLVSAVGETWSPLIQTLSPKDESQTYIFIRNSGEKVNVLVVTLERREGTVVQVSLSPHNLAILMQSPEDMGKAITNDATRDDN
ncbi:MAG: hypothetical protein JWM21_1168 [Acidobacteria bacterium]|nr:hypothetical protein [Acidobacteriota bacterium]